MAKKFATLLDDMPVARRKRLQQRTDSLVRGLRLQLLRRSRNLSQEALADVLGTNQANISKLESRDDFHLSTLREYVEALGGELEIRARFPEGDYTLSNLGSVPSTSAQAPRSAAGLPTSRAKQMPKKSRLK